MRKLILSAVLAAATMVYTGCSSGGDGDGGGGTGGGGTGGGMTPLSFDAETSLPATGGAAAVMVFATQFGNTMSAILGALGNAPGAPSFGASPKINIPVPGFCAGGGTATLDWNDANSDGVLSMGDVVTLVLDSCAGSSLAAAAVSGDVTLTITNVSGDGAFIDATAEVDLTISPNTTITGSFVASAQVSIDSTKINLFLGAQLDSDRLTVSEGDEVLQLGCFGISQRISLLEPGFVAPLGVANLAGQVYTINDYATLPPPIGFDANGVPSTGNLTLYSGDGSAEGIDRSGPCAPFVGTPAGDTSLVTATFSGGGCIDLNGVNRDGTTFQTSTTWDKLLDRDFTAGGGDSCGNGGTDTTPATAAPVPCPAGEDLVASADAYVRGGQSAEVDYKNFAYGNAPNLVIKSVTDLSFSRKIYIVFDLSTAPSAFTKASLVLTLVRHVINPDPLKSGPQPVDVYGIVDNNDWDPDPLNPGGLAEDAITWNNAPRNNTAAGNAFEDSAGVPRLIPGYDLDLAPLEAIDPPGTKYGLDVTDYVKWALGQNPDFSSSSPSGDDDDQITLLMAIPTLVNVDGSEFKSLDIPDGEMCDRPFLHFE
jgi:hypothetical protein